MVLEETVVGVRLSWDETCGVYVNFVEARTQEGVVERFAYNYWQVLYNTYEAAEARLKKLQGGRRMKQTKIDWCDCTVNAVVGCPRGCEYCYARRMNERFKWVEDWNKPQFFPERLKAFESKTPKSVFINSMSDIAYWTRLQVLTLFYAMIKNPQHRYIALTKDYEKWCKVRDEAVESTTADFSILNDIFFVGRTIDRNDRMPDEFIVADFINIEPIEEEIETERLVGNVEYCDGSGFDVPMGRAIIVGAETGNRKGKVIPQKHWIDKLARFADEWNIPIFMKESLRQLMGDEFRQDKLPWMKR